MGAQIRGMGMNRAEPLFSQITGIRAVLASVETAWANCHQQFYFVLKNKLNPLQNRKQALYTALYIPLNSHP